MNEWKDEADAPLLTDVLVKRDVGTYHVAMKMEDGRWVEWFCNSISRVKEWREIPK